MASYAVRFYPVRETRSRTGTQFGVTHLFATMDELLAFMSPLSREAREIAWVTWPDGKEEKYAYIQHGERADTTTTPKEFVEFWLENSIHADESLTARRDRKAVQNLADRCLAAAEEQGFSEDQITAEIGDIYEHIRGLIDKLNTDENNPGK
jgi:hypothetical protein